MKVLMSIDIAAAMHARRETTFKPRMTLRTTYPEPESLLRRPMVICFDFELLLLVKTEKKARQYRLRIVETALQLLSV